MAGGAQLVAQLDDLVEREGSRLRRTGYLLTGSWQTADELTRSALLCVGRRPGVLDDLPRAVTAAQTELIKAARSSATAGPAPTPASQALDARTSGSESTDSEPVIAERCPLAATERYDAANSQPVAGGYMGILPVSEPAPTGDDSGTIPDDERQCMLGYHRAPARTAITSREVLDPSHAHIVTNCSRWSGFDLSDPDWRLVRSAASDDPSTPTQVAAFRSRSGWYATCRLEMNQPSLWIARMDDGTESGCPSISPEFDDALWGERDVTFTGLRLTTVTPLLGTDHEPLASAAKVRLTNRALGLDWSLPAGNGMLVANTAHRLAHRQSVDNGPDGASPPPMVVQVFDAGGRQLLRCTTTG